METIVSLIDSVSHVSVTQMKDGRIIVPMIRSEWSFGMSERIFMRIIVVCPLLSSLLEQKFTTWSILFGLPPSEGLCTSSIMYVSDNGCRYDAYSASVGVQETQGDKDGRCEVVGGQRETLRVGESQMGMGT